MTEAPNFWLIAIPAASGLTGVVVGALFTRWNDKRKQKLEFVAQQLREFYSPLLGFRTHILSVSELREVVRGKASVVWGDMLEEAKQRGGQPALEQLRQDRWPEFEKLL